jgi:hypothetical protein
MTMRIVDVKVIGPVGDEPVATVTIEFMEYEVQELANAERVRIERGLSVGDARVALDRFNVLRLALNKAAEARRS